MAFMTIMIKVHTFPLFAIRPMYLAMRWGNMNLQWGTLLFAWGAEVIQLFTGDIGLKMSLFFFPLWENPSPKYLFFCLCLIRRWHLFFFQISIFSYFPSRCHLLRLTTVTVLKYSSWQLNVWEILFMIGGCIKHSLDAVGSGYKKKKTFPSD